MYTNLFFRISHSSMATLPDTMRAMVWRTSKGGIEKNLKLENVLLPKNASNLPSGSTLVKIEYSSLNPVDYKFADGLPFLFFKPAIPCLDFAGMVVHCGVSSSNLQPETRVFGRSSPFTNGDLAEYMVVSSDVLVPVPAAVSLSHAACIPTVAMTAWCGLKPYIKAGDHVLVNGASGGVGSFAVQLAKKLGAAHVTAVCSTPKVQLSKDIGADEVIDYKTQDVAAVLKAGGQRYDLAYDNVGIELFASAEDYLKPTGRFATPALKPTFADLIGFFLAMLRPGILGGVCLQIHCRPTSWRF